MAVDISAVLAAARASGRRALHEFDAKQLIETMGVAVPRGIMLAPDVDDHTLRAAFATIETPAVLKFMSDDVLHKSDAGAVKLDLRDAQAAIAACDELRANSALSAARVDGYLLETMAPSGIEVVVGAVHDPNFGPMVMLGLGGIFIEIIKDVTFRLCPLSDADAHAMLDELKASPMLAGARGARPVNRHALIEVLLAVGGAQGLMMRHGGDIAELDLNPVIATEHGAVAVDARVILRDDAKADALNNARQLTGDVLTRFEPLFNPAAIGVVGASASSTTIANTFIRRLKDFGYSGRIFPVHPSAPDVEGLPTIKSLAGAPSVLDYVYVAIGAERVPPLLADAGGNVRFAQVISGGFREVEEGVALEQQLFEAATAGKLRVLGPNCLGLYSPRGGVAFSADAPVTAGRVGVLCQSGGLGTDIVKRGQSRGVGYSAVVTIGNCVDLQPADYLEYFLADPNTDVIGCYLEDVGDGRAFFDLLRLAPTPKPVVMLRGGRTAAGQVAAASHTGALAGDGRAWQALAAQTPVSEVRTVDEFVDALLMLQTYATSASKSIDNVVLFGNGGGTSVLATDCFADHGLAVTSLAGDARAALDALELPPGTSVANPIDTPVATLQAQDGGVARTILDIIYARTSAHAVVMHLNLASFVGRGDSNPVANLVDAALATQSNYADGPHFVLVLRSDGSEALDEARRHYRALALAAGIPVYDELVHAAAALAVLDHTRRAFARRNA